MELAVEIPDLILDFGSFPGAAPPKAADMTVGEKKNPRTKSQINRTHRDENNERRETTARNRLSERDHCRDMTEKLLLIFNYTRNWIIKCTITGVKTQVAW